MLIFFTEDNYSRKVTKLKNFKSEFYAQTKLSKKNVMFDNLFAIFVLYCSFLIEKNILTALPMLFIVESLLLVHV